MAKKPLLLATSDWHAAKCAWARYPTLAGDSYYGIKQIAKIAQHYNVPVIAAGDLFDKTSPDSDTVWFVNDTIKDYGIRVYFTQGQHEKVRGRPWLYTNKLVQHIHNKIVEINGFNIYGIDYTRPDVLQEEIEQIPAKDIELLVMHQVWRNFMGDFVEGDGQFEQLPPVPMLITGDFHKTCIHNSTVMNKPFTALSPGSVCMQSIDEPSDKCVFLVYEDLSVKIIGLKSRFVYRNILNTEEELQIFIDGIVDAFCVPQLEVPEHISKNILDIKYNHDIADAYARITKAVGDRAHLFIRKLKSYSRENNEMLQPTDKSVKGLEAYLSTKCDPGTPVFNNIIRLLHTNNPAVEVDTIVQEALNKN